MGKKSWKDPSIIIDKIYVEESCVDLPYTKEILNRAKLPYTIVPDRGKPNNLDKDYVNNLTAGKRQLFLCKNRGHFFKPCPGTRDYQCCDYQVLNTGMNCPMDCVYCILQAYLNAPWLTFYVNYEKLFKELDDCLHVDTRRFFRIGTGEFTDSLAIDRLTGLSRLLVNYIGKQENAILELKTKSGFVENLAGLEHNERTIVAWSLNSPVIMQKEEIRSATLDERLTSARYCANLGYKLAFHFDPIIDHSGWKEGYTETIERLFQEVPADAIVWISLGALRFIPSLKEIGIQRFPHSRIYYQEFVEGLDNKSRYFRLSRVKLYTFIYELLKTKVSEKTCVYFCMESDEIWKEVMGFDPGEKGGIPYMLDKAAKREYLI